MVQYFLRRLFALIPVLFLISIFVFLFVHALPGDPARVLAGDNATLEEVEIVRRAWMHHYINSILILWEISSTATLGFPYVLVNKSAP